MIIMIFSDCFFLDLDNVMGSLVVKRKSHVNAQRRVSAASMLMLSKKNVYYNYNEIYDDDIGIFCMLINLKLIEDGQILDISLINSGTNCVYVFIKIFISLPLQPNSFHSASACSPGFEYQNNN